MAGPGTTGSRPRARSRPKRAGTQIPAKRKSRRCPRISRRPSKRLPLALGATVGPPRTTAMELPSAPGNQLSSVPGEFADVLDHLAVHAAKWSSTLIAQQKTGFRFSEDCAGAERAHLRLRVRPISLVSRICSTASDSTRSIQARQPEFRSTGWRAVSPAPPTPCPSGSCNLPDRPEAAAWCARKRC